MDWKIEKARSGGVESDLAVAVDRKAGMPPLLAGHETEETRQRVESFYKQVAEIFERWVTRSASPHTQRAYRRDVLTFVEFMGWVWPDEGWRFLTANIGDVSSWRELMIEQSRAPKTINRRLASVSSFYKFLAGCASEARLPVTVPNPAHVQFIQRLGSDPVHETQSLSATRARQLMGLVTGEAVMAYQDRAILKTLLYTGIRIGTLQRLDVADFHDEEQDSTLEITEKGNKRRRIGIHFAAAQAIREHLKWNTLETGPLFRAQHAPRATGQLGYKRISITVLWRKIGRYLSKLPGAVVKETVHNEVVERCIYTPHSLRATTATLLLEAGVDITKVQELLGHCHVTTTQIYDKRRRTTKESASHDMPI